jgi:hypothetical protein
LHALDFARIISSFSKAAAEPDNVYDLSLYELERRAAITSAEYLVRIGLPDYIDDGLKLNLVKLDENGTPLIDMDGIESRMQNGYGLNANVQGSMMSKSLGLRKNGSGSGLARLLGFVR